MNQFELLKTIHEMRTGQCVDIGFYQLREAASEDMTLLDRMAGGANPKELKEFIQKISVNWGVRISERLDPRLFTIEKL